MTFFRDENREREREREILHCIHNLQCMELVDCTIHFDFFFQNNFINYYHSFVWRACLNNCRHEHEMTWYKCKCTKKKTHIYRFFIDRFSVFFLSPSFRFLFFTLVINIHLVELVGPCNELNIKHGPHRVWMHQLHYVCNEVECWNNVWKYA